MSSQKLHSTGAPGLRVPSLGLRFQSQSTLGGEEPSDRPGLLRCRGSHGQAVSGPEHHVALCLHPSEATTKCPGVKAAHLSPLWRAGPTRNGAEQRHGGTRGERGQPRAPAGLGTSPQPLPPWRRDQAQSGEETTPQHL